MKQVIILLLLLTGVAIRTNAQTGSITGTVRDEKKEPMIGAVVQVFEGGLNRGGAATDIDGKYTVKPLKPGRYEVRIAYTAYKTNIITGVIISPDKTTTVNATMEVNTKAIDEVSVIAYKVPLIDKYSPGTSTTITSETIDRMPTRSTNSVARSSTNINDAQSGGQLNIQGGRNNQTVYYIDGIQTREARKSKDMKVVPPQAQYFNPSEESYSNLIENDFMSVKTNPLSTLSVDVDRASYSNVRRFINSGQRPPADAVRVEEMINYFDYDYPQPHGEDPIAIVTELTDCPWQAGHKLLHVGMQARKIDMEDLPPSNIVFLIDVSGSMYEQNKLPLVKSALKMVVKNMREQDKISIVVYAGNAGLVLPPTSGDDKNTIIAALNALEAGGSTAGGAGIQLAYKTAQENFVHGSNNRIILATDGDFNVGVSSENELEDLITKEREKGIFLTCLGFGRGNYKDSKMEILADKGNGNYAYIDNLQEAQKTLVKEFGGTLFTVAKDVKAQIEFNPEQVQAYRLIGYENRLLNEEDFKDDKKDAGEMGAGHTVTMLYEIIPTGVKSNFVRKTNDLKYQERTIDDSYEHELATIKFRYKQPEGSKSREMVHTIADKSTRWEHTSNNIRFATSVAMFGMLLTDSKFKGASSYNKVVSLAEISKGKDKDGYRSEFVRLVKSVDENDDIKTSAR